MNCKDIQDQLNAYVDRELDVMGSLEVEKHLQACAQCRQAVENQAVLKKAITASAPYFKAPASLRDSIITSARRAAQPQQPRATAPIRHRLWEWNALSASLAMAASLVLGFFLAAQLQRHSAREQLVDEITASHVRSLIVASHIMDVVSTDQHTVKPWFDGKLDFAPPVTNFAAQDFPLVGGRIDYINGRNVAVLIYQKRKHFINVFIWPAAGGGESPRTTAKNGYNIVNWNDAGMTFWAVSDVAPDDLQTLAGLFEKGAPAPAGR